MTPELYAQICELVNQAEQLPEAERDRFIDSACGPDTELRHAIRQMLKSAAASGQLPTISFDPLRQLVEPRAGETMLSSRRIGPYLLTRILGQGGMGTVYLAIRVDDFQQQVAIKLIKHNQGTLEFVQRFRKERQVLASLNHPHIARLLDGGSTENGWPYLVMEFIAGTTIERYCDVQALGTSQRVALFRQVCAAVDYAHQQTIIHRDLKPSNVLVTAEGQPKVLDFGLAKHLDHDPAGPDAWDETQTGAILGTPSYMAPEQAQGVRNVGPAADVYSLGAILYELLTGRPPFKGTSRLETLRQVLEQDAVPVRVLNNAIPRDLETICMKCLDKQPARRYDSATALAEDLRRFQDSEPIQARPAGQMERMFLWSRRHPLASAGLLAVLVLIVLVGLGAGRYRRDLEATRLRTLVNSLPLLEPDQTSRFRVELAPYGTRPVPLLQQAFHESASAKARLNASLALLPYDSGQIDFLLARGLQGTPGELVAIQAAISEQGPKYRERLAQTLEDQREQMAPRLHAACLFAPLAPADFPWEGLADGLVESLVRENPVDFADWLRALEPIKAYLISPLRRRLLASPATAEATAAAILLGSLLQDRPADVVDLIPTCTPQQIGYLAPALQHPLAAQLLLSAWKNYPHPTGGAVPSGDEREHYHNEQLQKDAHYLLALLHAGQREPVRQALGFSPRPQLRTYLIPQFAQTRFDPRTFMDWLNEETEPAVIQALILALGHFEPTTFSGAEQDQLHRALFKNLDHADSGVHSACSWLLQKHGLREPLDAAIGKQVRADPVAGQDWYQDPLGHSFAVVQGPVEFLMGAHTWEWGRAGDNEPLHRRRISRSFAIATHEVTAKDFLQFAQQRKQLLPPNKHHGFGWSSRTPDSPAVEVTWYEAALFCNWLSERAGIPPEQWVYPQPDPGQPESLLKAVNLEKTGFRLPTESEWEFACRAGVVSSYGFGSDSNSLPLFGWCTKNSRHCEPVGQLMPNFRGLFDTHGNCYEWCHACLDPIAELAAFGTHPDEAPDPEPPGPTLRVVRGGDFSLTADRLRSAGRLAVAPEHSWPASGLRLARTWETPALDVFVRQELATGVEFYLAGREGTARVVESGAVVPKAKDIKIPGTCLVSFPQQPVAFDLVLKRTDGETKYVVSYQPIFLNWEGEIHRWLRTDNNDDRGPTPAEWEQSLATAPLLTFQEANRRCFEQKGVLTLPADVKEHVLLATAEIDWPAGSYEFTVTGFDGLRLFLDDRPVLALNWDVYLNRPNAQVEISPGRHRLRLENYRLHGTVALRVEVRRAGRQQTTQAEESPN